MRLIDADKVINILKDRATNEAVCGYMTAYDVTNSIIDEIDEQSTVYDVDKVVEQLEDMKSLYFSGDMTQAMLKEQYNKAVDDFANLYKNKTSMENNLVDEIAEHLKINEPHKGIIKLMIEMLEASEAGFASVKLGQYTIIVTTEDKRENFKCN